MKPLQSLGDYINSLSGDERETFAEACGTTIGYLRKAISAEQTIGEGLAMAIERASQRKVTCEQLRPDVDWNYIRGTARVGKTDAARP